MGNDKNYFESDDDEVLSAEILEFAREYQSNDFPNPNRKDCPPNEELLKIVDSGALPGMALREHLLNCSPCFLEFNAARQIKAPLPAAADRTPDVKHKFPWLSVFLRPFPVAALLLLLGLFTLTGIFCYVRFYQTKPEIARQTNSGDSERIAQNPQNIANPENLPAENKPPVINQTIPKQNKPTAALKNKEIKTETEVKPPATEAVRLDLAKAAVLRNQISNETVYSLPARAVALDVKLPADSPAGKYEVSVLDEFGKPLLKNLSADSTGNNLRVKLNLQNRRGRARLCIAPKGEIPDCFAVTIGQAD